MVAAKPGIGAVLIVCVMLAGMVGTLYSLRIKEAPARSLPAAITGVQIAERGDIGGPPLDA